MTPDAAVQTPTTSASTVEPQQHGDVEDRAESQDPVEEVLVEEISIDGMCGVY